MMRSMFSGVSSLRVHQTKMDVIANNIANVNTDGFKSQRATFADAFYQNLQGASGPDPQFGRSGTNPQQVGLGLKLASIDNLMQQGIARRTDNALDLAIEGGGFFIVQDRGGANLFTRAGRIERDADWNLHIGGNMLMGWGTVADPNTPGGYAVDRGLLAPISLSGDKQSMPSEPTTQVNIAGNLNSTQLSTRIRNGVEEQYRTVPMTIYDSLGNSYVVNIDYVYHKDMSTAADSPYSYWTMELQTGSVEVDAGPPPVMEEGVLAYLEGDRKNPVVIGMCLLGGADITAGGSISDFQDNMNTVATIAFNSNGDLVGIGRADVDAVSGNPIPVTFNTAAATGWPMAAADNWMNGNVFEFDIVPIAKVAPAATFGNTGGVTSSYEPPPPSNTTLTQPGVLTFNFQELGQRGQENTSIRALRMDGGGPGTLTDISVGADGTIYGRYSNGRDRILGQVPLAFFSNPAGLERVGNSFWRTTANSGAFDGVGLIGQMIGGALEGSNVDLAEQFTEMITTQRGFQAASRTITVSDELLQELVNLKR
ncbi:MAG: flagellar hook protein FlgE [Clostridiales bacterium]|jgi:flagellar hook protein FlgE|nr:flagellar hook protein FlgE [Clostridiales bacterium]